VNWRTTDSPDFGLASDDASATDASADEPTLSGAVALSQANSAKVPAISTQ
jgi:hypothetical protein